MPLADLGELVLQECRIQPQRILSVFHHSNLKKKVSQLKEFSWKLGDLGHGLQDMLQKSRLFHHGARARVNAFCIVRCLGKSPHGVE